MCALLWLLPMVFVALGLRCAHARPHGLRSFYSALFSLSRSLYQSFLNCKRCRFFRNCYRKCNRARLNRMPFCAASQSTDSVRSMQTLTGMNRSNYLFTLLFSVDGSWWTNFSKCGNRQAFVTVTFGRALYQGTNCNCGDNQTDGTRCQPKNYQNPNARRSKLNHLTGSKDTVTRSFRSIFTRLQSSESRVAYPSSVKMRIWMRFNFAFDLATLCHQLNTIPIINHHHHHHQHSTRHHLHHPRRSSGNQHLQLIIIIMMKLVFVSLLVSTVSSFAPSISRHATLRSTGTGAKTSASPITDTTTKTTTQLWSDQTNGLNSSNKSGASSKKVIVLGGDGFCGWPTSLYLSDQGHDIVVVDNLSRRNIDIELGCDSLTPIQSPEVRMFCLKCICTYACDLHVPVSLDNRC